MAMTWRDLLVAILDPLAAVLDFVDRINSGDVDAVLEAMTPDHEFIDTAGSSIRGRDALRDAWAAYFRLFPDYHIEIERVVERDDEIVLVGTSTGTLSPTGRVELAGPDGDPPSDEELQGPAIWSGRIRAGLISEWTVFEDTVEVRDSLGISQ
jgi:hypothetical protein